MNRIIALRRARTRKIERKRREQNNHRRSALFDAIPDFRRQDELMDKAMENRIAELRYIQKNYPFTPGAAGLSVAQPSDYRTHTDQALLSLAQRQTS